MKNVGKNRTVDGDVRASPRPKKILPWCTRAVRRRFTARGLRSRAFKNNTCLRRLRLLASVALNVYHTVNNRTSFFFSSFVLFFYSLLTFSFCLRSAHRFYPFYFFFLRKLLPSLKNTSVHSYTNRFVGTRPVRHTATLPFRWFAINIAVKTLTNFCNVYSHEFKTISIENRQNKMSNVFLTRVYLFVF
uniref:Transmembrane protein n=1 Tax=Sipha flava TaxID=143950 RepID=A0A2S2QI51_9HEMI